MPTYTYDHIHLRSKDPMGMAKYFEKMFDAQSTWPFPRRVSSDACRQVS